MVVALFGTIIGFNLKTIKYKVMKRTIKLVSVLFLSAFLMVGFNSCSKDTDPADVDVFLGTYNGHITYSKSGGNSIDAPDGKVVVTKVGDACSLAFSDSIPEITGVKFEKSNDSTYVSDGSGVTGITISANTLKMSVVKGDETWTADCAR